MEDLVIQSSVGTRDEKEPRGRPGHIELLLKWILTTCLQGVAYGRDKWWDIVNAAIDLRVL